MTEREDQAYQAAHDAAATLPDLLTRVADRLGAHIGASAVFGEPVEKGNRTVIPVAQTMIGTGGGGGSSDGEGSGLGAGGGAMTRPLGYIEVTSAGAAFVPLSPPWADPKLVLVYGLMALVVGRTLVRMLRG